MANAPPTANTVESSADAAPAIAVSPSEAIVSSAPQLDRSLGELRSARRLEKLTASIESFLLSQIGRIQKSLQQCKEAVDQNQVVQRILADFDRQKEAWELERHTEIQRLFAASEKLVQGWKQLEDERQAWLADRQPGGSPRKP